jgi:hypothetical protein
MTGQNNKSAKRVGLKRPLEYQLGLSQYFDSLQKAYQMALRIRPTNLHEFVMSCVRESMFRKRKSLASIPKTKEYQRLFKRGECWVCGAIVGQDLLECGHLVDYCCGGADSPQNVMPMCTYCNRVLKPCHDSLDEVMRWRESVRTTWKQRALEYVRDFGPPPRL